MKQTSKNLITNIINLLSNILIGLLYVPYLVNSLGVAAYGVLPLALIINQYVNVLTGALTGAITRFYSISLKQNDYNKASQYLSTAFGVLLCFSLLFIPIVFFIIKNLDSLFNIPSELLNSGKILFFFTLISFFISLFSSLFNVSLYAYNKLSTMNWIKITRTVSKVLGVVIFFSLFRYDIKWVGIASFIAELIVLGISITLFYKYTQDKVSIKLKYIAKEHILVIFSMTSWILLHKFGDVFIYKIDNILVNRFWGTSISGVLGAVSELGGYMVTVIDVFASLFGPIVLITYAKGDIKRMVEIASNNSHLICITASFICAFVIMFASPILTFWLGPNFAPYGDWLSLKIACIPFISSSAIFAFVYRTYNKVKYPAIVALICGLLNTGIMLILFNHSHNTAIISIALFIQWFIIYIQSYFYGTFYLQKIENRFSFISFTKISSLCIVLMLISYFIGKNYIHINSFKELLGYGSLCGIILLTIYLLLLQKIGLFSSLRNVLKNIEE